MKLFSIGNIAFYMGAFGFTFWMIFITRKLFGLVYKPYTDHYEAKATVVIPSFNEDEEILKKCISSVIANNPYEVICIFNGEINGYEKMILDNFPTVKFFFIPFADKRQAMVKGVLESSTDSKIIAFADSDVIWESNTLEELLKPFRENKVGGVSTHQIIDNANASIWTTVGSWLTHQGLTTGSAFQSVSLCASCLRGRTAAYRKEMLLIPGFLEEFNNEIFMGARCKSGDDGRLTFLTLKYGWGTFVQSTSVIHTTLPEKPIKFLKHRLRCNRNTYRRYLGSITQKWFWQQNWRFGLEFISSFIIPLGFFVAVYSLLSSLWELNLIYAGVLFTWFCIGRMLRSPSWISQNPIRIVKFPLMVLIFIGPLLFTRWYALATLKEHRWGTR